MSGGSAESAVFAARKRAMMGVVQLTTRETARELIGVYKVEWLPTGSRLCNQFR